MAVPFGGDEKRGEVEEGNSNLLGWVINQADNIINQRWDRSGKEVGLELPSSVGRGLCSFFFFSIK